MAPTCASRAEGKPRTQSSREARAVDDPAPAWTARRAGGGGAAGRTRHRGSPHTVRSPLEPREKLARTAAIVTRRSPTLRGGQGPASYDGPPSWSSRTRAVRPTAEGPRLAGRRCVVTGAARGIGAEIARTYARAGASVGVLDVAPDVKAVAAELDGPVELADLADVTATGEALRRLVHA